MVGKRVVMKNYEIWLTSSNGDSKSLVKRYPFEIQAVIWCFINKFVNSGRGYYFLDPRVEIKEVNYDN